MKILSWIIFAAVIIVVGAFLACFPITEKRNYVRHFQLDD
jgi:hypothetical protein